MRAPWRLMALALLAGSAAALAAEGARVEYVEGDVWLESAGRRVRADFGSAVTAGDLIITGADGAAVVTVSRGSQIKLRANTVVSIDDITGGGSVGLRSGGVFARAQRAVSGRSFQVTTPTVVAGVRGTEFFVAYGRSVEAMPDLWLCVNTGSVEIAVPTTGARTIVNQGEGINILAGVRTTRPQFYPWTLDLNWSFDPAEGDIRDTTDLSGAYADLLDQDYD